MKTLEKFALMFALIGSTLLLSGNTVYQWTDENGVVHFSQTAPDSNQEAVETTLRSAPKTGGSVASTPEPTPAPAESQEAAGPEATAEEVAAPSYTKIPENCDKARAMLATLSEGAERQIRFRDPETGEYYIASDQDRDLQRQRALAQVEKDC